MTQSFTEEKTGGKRKLPPAKRAALLGMTGALALIINRLEYLLPALPFLPPGAKPGFSNLAVMLAVSEMPASDAFLIVLLKAGFALVTRGATAALTSLFGGVLSYIVLLLTLKREKSPFGMIGIGILSALAHNSGQLLAACIMTGSMKTLAYAPALTVFALISGSATGAVYGAVYRRIHNMIDNRGLFEK